MHAIKQFLVMLSIALIIGCRDADARSGRWIWQGNKEVAKKSVEEKTVVVKSSAKHKKRMRRSAVLKKHTPMMAAEPMQKTQEVTREEEISTQEVAPMPAEPIEEQVNVEAPQPVEVRSVLSPDFSPKTNYLDTVDYWQKLLQPKPWWENLAKP